MSIKLRHISDDDLSTTQPMIEQTFKALGFTANEAALYLMLAETGKSTIQLLAKRAKLPRTTAYSVLEGLAQKGLVSEEKRGASRFFVANQPQALLRMVKREREELSKREKIAELFVEELKPLFRSKFFSVPKIQFFEGREAVEAMLYDFTPRWIESARMTDNIWWGYQDHTFVERYRAWLDYYWSVKHPDNKIQLISNDAPVEKELKGKVQGRQILPVPGDFNFSSTIWVCGEYISLVMTRNEPNYAFLIQDAVFAENMRLLFRLLWGMLGKAS